MRELIENINVFGIKESIIASGYPMNKNMLDNSIELGLEDDEYFAKRLSRADKLAACPVGAAHDNFLKGCIVQFDLYFTEKGWTQFQRYHFADFVSSHSMMYCATKFELKDEMFSERVTEKAKENLKELVAIYNAIPQDTPEDKRENRDALLEAKRNILDNIPSGTFLKARITTNYQQLKTIYKQRKLHDLEVWRKFCQEIKEKLPYSEWITGEKEEA